MTHPAENPYRFERIGVLAMLGAITAWLGYVQFSAMKLFGVDGLYHIRLADMYGSGWFSHRFPWLYHTDFAQAFTDHHFLFHILMIPFAWLSPGDELMFGANLGALVMGVSALACLGGVLLAFKVRFAALWMLAALVASEVFAARLLLPRAQSVTLIFVTLTVLALSSKRYKTAAALSFFFSWAYQLSLMNVLVGAAFALALWIRTGRFDSRPLIVCAVAVFAGFILNPFAPQSLEFLLTHALFKVTNPVDLAVGGEWKSTNPLELFRHLAVFHVILALGALAFVRDRKTLHTETLAMGMVAVAMFPATCHSWRFLEYYPFLVVFACALVIRDLFPQIAENRPQKQLIHGLLALSLAVFCAVRVGALASWLPDRKAEGFDNSRLLLAAHWLEGHGEAETLAVNADWSDFPFLFYNNRHNFYATGLDPNLFLYHDPKRFAAYHELVTGRAQNPSKTLRESLGGRYLIYRYNRAKRNMPPESWTRLVEHPGWKVVYHDAEGLIFDAGKETGKDTVQ